MKVAELGEHALIQRLAELVDRKQKRSRRLLLGIGDDAAAWRGRPSVQLHTIDTLVQGVHFNLEYVSWRDLGWKALAVNISDIAAMGGVPACAVVSLGLPGETEVAQVELLYHGMLELAQEQGVNITGGSTVGSPVVFIGIALEGEALRSVAYPGNVMLRSAAKPGDAIAVTGHLGSSAGGLRVMLRGLRLSREAEAYLKQAHLHPQPPVAEGQVLVRQGVRAAIDVSDGLLSDLAKMARASRLAARVWRERLPVHPYLADAFGEEALALATSGGEDYELLFAAPREVVELARPHLARPVTVIGEMTAGELGKVSLLDPQGREVPWGGGGWEHFMSPSMA